MPNNSKNKNFREWNPRRSDEQDVMMTSSAIQLSQMFVSQVIAFKKSIHHDVVGIMVTSDSRLSICSVLSVFQSLCILIIMQYGLAACLYVGPPTTFTCDQYAHHVVIYTFCNANNFRESGIELREWNL